MKLKLLFTAAAATVIFHAASGQTDGVSIDYSVTPAREPKAILQLNSTQQGFIVPRMTAAQKTAIAPPGTASAMLIYQTDGTQGFYYWTGAAWVLIGSGANITAGNDIDLTAPFQVDLEPQLDFVHTAIAPAANNLTLQAQTAV
ncbi:MAG: hypothetical protein AB7G44_09655 [Bacteroidia bacterium]